MSEEGGTHGREGAGAYRWKRGGARGARTIVEEARTARKGCAWLRSGERRTKCKVHTRQGVTVWVESTPPKVL
jgi:hypothetical protein